MGRFLIEANDIVRKKTNNLELSLDCSSGLISELYFDEMKREFLSGVPFPYLLQEVDFYYHTFFLNSSVLIPRPETEYLVDLIVKENKGKINKILDVGTGSGVILLSLILAGVGNKGVGSDLSSDALRIFEINAKKFGLEDKTSSLLSDRLERVQGTFDLIVSNPPYIKISSHKNLVHPMVHRHEPSEALFLPDDLYASWFENFFKQLRSHLDGVFYMEGHELELDGQAEVIRKMGFCEVEVLNDLTRRPRFLKARFSP